MEIRTIEDCFRERLLRRIGPSGEKTEKSMEVAKKRLDEAKRAIDSDFFSFAVIESYTAMFHAARALLYRDGIQEKSHYATFIYMKEKYGSKIPLNIINFLNIHRVERHDTLYGLDYEPKEDDAITALEDAGVFVAEVQKIL
jgi:uncharacterized protein (UPF0332 family)